jgi:hypothetical protein
MYSAHTERHLNPESGLGDEIYTRWEKTYILRRQAAFKKHRQNIELYHLRTLFITEKAGSIIMRSKLESMRSERVSGLFQGTIWVFA